MSTSIDTEIRVVPEKTKPIKFGAVDLDMEGAVDPYTFSDSIRTLLPTPKFAFGGYAQETKAPLKFIVAQSKPENEGDKPRTKMYVFYKDALHSDLYKQLLEAGGSYTLLSAGYLDLFLGERNALLRGELSQYSDSLERDFQLDRAISDNYKEQVLVKKLGRHFTAR